MISRNLCEKNRESKFPQFPHCAFLNTIRIYHFLIFSTALFRLPKAEGVLGPELLRWIDLSPEMTVPIMLKNARIVPNHLESKNEIMQKMCEYALASGHCTSFNDDEVRNRNENTFSAIIWTLSTMADQMPKSAYILEKLLDLAPVELVINSELLLLAGVKVFLHSPAETQHILGRIFQLCLTHNDDHVKDKVRFYAQLLRHRPELLCQQILSIKAN